MSIVSRLRNAWEALTTKSFSRVKLVSEYTGGTYMWDGKLYKSDIIRSCIRPKSQAIGKICGIHLRESSNGDIKRNPVPYIRFLLEDPNPYMSGQMLQEKLANQVSLNGNAFALIIRDENDLPCEIYPINAVSAEAIYSKSGDLLVRFTLVNGSITTFAYKDLLHLRKDFSDNDVFGANQFEPLQDVMNVIGTIDSGIIRAIKNSGVVRWLLIAKSSLRPEDLKANVTDFVNNYLSVESDTFGAAGVDSKFDAKQIESQDVLPGADLLEQQRKRVLDYFNTNEKIVSSSFTEEDWNSYYQNEIEPLVLQFSNEWTRKLFSRRERASGNRISFEAINLQCASIKTKLELSNMVDRGALLPNEWRHVLNLSPIEGGDKPIRRLDTQQINAVNRLLENITPENAMSIADAITAIMFDVSPSESGKLADLALSGDKHPEITMKEQEGSIDA